jgi:hypothetical protein
VTADSKPIDRLDPVRGLIVAQNAKGKSVSTVDLERWIRLNRVVYKTEKIDMLWRGCDVNGFAALQQTARKLDAVLSLRTDCAEPPPSTDALRSAGLWDLFLCPPKFDAAHVGSWLSAAREAALAVRVQLCGPFELDLDVNAVASRFAEFGVVSIDIAAHDPFTETLPARNARHTESSVSRMNELAAACHAQGIETNLLWLPLCETSEENRKLALNSHQYFIDHQHYQRDSWELARRLYRKRPARIRLAILMHLEQETSTANPIDRILLPWIMEHPWVRARIWALHKLTRHRRLRTPAKMTEPSPAEHMLAAEHAMETRRNAKGPICAQCSLKRICDGLTPELTRALPGLAITAQNGEPAIDPFQFVGERPRYYDAIDAARRDATVEKELVDAANALIMNRAPSREVSAFDYRVEGTWSWPLPGCLRWFSFTNSEKISTPLTRVDPPFALSVTFGGGIAEYVGFALGKGCRLVCPMTAYNHRVMLHVAADGRYVLLRDGKPVRPVQFAGTYYAPVRLGKGLEPRISIWNIDGTIGTQAVYLWEEERASQTESTPVRFSVVVVSTRYARRLQACLENLTNQNGVQLCDIEVIVAFVPDIDATEDVLDSIQIAHPGIRIVPTAFAPEHAKSKGLLLNECLSKTRGEWVLVLDADILLAPEMLAKLAELPPECMFAIPDGRKMLSRETTARVLLGEIRPWEHWEQLLQSEGEYRMREADGVPVGYCQCVRRECLDKVQYEEMHHFEGADWKFGKDMRETFGQETRLSGVPVLHLDHGSSNWYGAARHY